MDNLYHDYIHKCEKNMSANMFKNNLKQGFQDYYDNIITNMCIVVQINYHDPRILYNNKMINVNRFSIDVRSTQWFFY